jgi:hypothetical protein
MEKNRHKIKNRLREPDNGEIGTNKKERQKMNAELEI